MATTQLDTVPASRDITTDSADTWSIDFANVLQDGESVSAGSAALFTDMPGDAGAAVAGFVTGATPSGTAVNVTWTAETLQKWSTYQLQTKAVLNTGSVIELITLVRVVG